MNKIALGLMILWLTGCGVSYHVTTDALADIAALPSGFPRRSSFSIIPPESDNPLFVKQVAHKLAKALEQQGHTVQEDEADYRLFFECKMAQEKVVVKETQYFPGQTEDKKGFVRDGKGEVIYQQSTKASGEWKDVPIEKTLYTRELSLRVFDEEKEVWNAHAKSRGKTGDLREAVDYLLFPLISHFGFDTGKSLVSTVYEEDVQ
jgi:hypothetical protein